RRRSILPCAQVIDVTLAAFSRRVQLRSAQLSGSASNTGSVGIGYSEIKWIYLSSNAGGIFHTWRQRFPDGQPEQITSGPTEEEGIVLAPDGPSIVAPVGVRQSGVWAHDGRGDRKISLEGLALQPKFTPDEGSCAIRFEPELRANFG